MASFQNVPSTWHYRRTPPLSARMLADSVPVPPAGAASLDGTLKPIAVGLLDHAARPLGLGRHWLTTAAPPTITCHAATQWAAD